MVGCHPAMTSNSCLTFKCREKGKKNYVKIVHMHVWGSNGMDGWSTGVIPIDMGQDVSWILLAGWD